MEKVRVKHSSLLVVDMQRGFSELCPAELPVPGAVQIIPCVNQLLALPWPRIDASADWHPPDHCSFLGQRDNLYPPHCVQGTAGADFLPELHTDRFHAIWRKGYRSDVDAYAVTAQHPGFASLLHGAGVETVVVCGLAANICCFFAARDLRLSGFRVLLAEDASAGLDVPAAGLSQEKTRAAGQRLGIDYVSTAAVCAAFG